MSADSKCYYIATATDDKYYVPMYVMLLSLFENNKELTFNIVILYKNLDEDRKKATEILATNYDNTITWLSVDSGGVDKYYISAYITEATYYRIFLAELLPDSCKRILYLDADIVVNGSVKELLDIDMEELPLSAIKDILPFKPERFGIQPPHDYFNAGVLVMDLAVWRKNNYVTAVTNNIREKHSQYLLHDQDALNHFFHDKVKFIDPKWNHQTALYNSSKSYIESRYDIPVNDIFKNPVVIHFTGWLKPWHYLNTHPLKPVFIKYLDKTPYPDFAERATPALLFKRFSLRVKHKLKKLLNV